MSEGIFVLGNCLAKSDYPNFWVYIHQINRVCCAQHLWPPRAVCMVHGLRILLLLAFTLLSISNVSLELKGIYVTGDTLKAIVKTFCISNRLRHRSLYTDILYFSMSWYNLSPFNFTKVLFSSSFPSVLIKFVVLWTK